MSVPARVTAILGLALALAACKGYVRPDAFEGGQEVREPLQYFAASNGFRVFVLPDDHASVVRLELRYDVGAAHNPPGKEGLAHLVEHMMFQTLLPTERGQVTAMSELSRFAQHTNAYTTLDSTHYEVQVKVDDLERAFALEVARFASGCSTWTEQTFVREREVVRNEIRERHATVEGDIPRLLHESLYPDGHPYRQDVGGTDASLARITLADVCHFVETYYVPSRTTIFAVGATDEPAVRALAEKWLGQFPRTAPPEPVVAAPLAPARRTKVVHDLDIEQPLVYVMFPLPARGTRDYRMASMTAAPLRDAVWWRAATYDWADEVFVQEVGGARAPALALGVRVRNMNELDDALDAIWQAVRATPRGVARRGADREDRGWEYTRAFAQESLLARHEPLAWRGQVYADYVQFDARPLFLTGRLMELDQIGPQDLRRSAERLLDRDRATVVVFRPRPGSTARETGSFRYRGSVHGADHWKVEIDPSEADRPAWFPSRLTQPAAERFTLANGLEVVLWPHGQLPLVHGVLVIHAGSGDEPIRKAGLADAAGSAGVDVTVASSRDLTALAHNLVGRLSMKVRLHVTRDVDEWRKNWTRELRRPRVATRIGYGRDLRGALYGADHPYAAGEATPETLKRMSGSDIAAFRRKYHVAANATLILTGSFDTKQMREHVEYQFAALSEDAPRRQPLPVADRPAEPVFIGYDAADPESPVIELDALFLGTPGIDGDHAARLVAEGMLNGELRALREERAITYGMSVGYEPRRGQGLWRIAGDADAARAAEATTALRELLFDFHANARQKRASFVLARRNVVDGLLSDAVSPRAMAYRLAFIARFDLPDDFYVQLAQRVAKLTIAEVAAVVDRELAPDRGVYGVFGAPEAARAGIEAAKRVGSAPAAAGPAAAPADAEPADAEPAPATAP